MVLFELMASLGLDTSTFKQQADEAVADGEDVAKSVSDSFEKIQTEASDADTKLNDLETKSQTTSAIMEGFLQVTGELVQAAIEGIIEFGAQSIEAAAATGSELANSFNEAKSNFDLTMDALRIKTGNVLLPIAEGFYDIVASLSGVSDAERLELMLSRIQEYEFGNIQQLRESLNGVFGMFEKAENVEAASIEEMTGGLESQAAYWTDYADTLEALRSRNIDTKFLSEIADGTAESLETLKALETADTDQLENLMSAFAAVEETKGATVETIRGYQIAFDEDLLSMTKSVEDLVAGMNQEDAVRSNLMLTEQGIGEGMASIHSLMASWVGSINSELAKIGEMDAMSSVRVNENGVRRGGGAGTQRIPGHASGLSYVPYDDYGAYLHRGEAVLTRQQAEEYRAGSTARATDSTAVIRKLDAVVESIRGISVYLDGEKVGHALTPYVSGEIGREAGVFL